MKKVLILLLLACLGHGISLNAQTWAQVGKAYTHSGLGIKLTNGNYVYVNNYQNLGFDVHILDSIGRKTDSTHFAGSSSYPNGLLDLVPCQDGGFAALGTMASATDSIWGVFMKFDGLGNLLFTKRIGLKYAYFGVNNRNGAFLLENPDSSFILLFENFVYGTYQSRAILQKLDANGNTLWARNDSLKGQITNLVRSSNGEYLTFFNTGLVYLSATEHVEINRFDASGNLIFSKTVKLPDPNLAVNGATEAANGDLILVGAYMVPLPTIQYDIRPFLYQLDANGDSILFDTTNVFGAYPAEYASIILLPDSSLAIGADAYLDVPVNYPQDSIPRYSVVRYDKDLTLLKVLTTDTSLCYGHVAYGVQKIKYDPSGGFLLMGNGIPRIPGPGNLDICSELVRIDTAMVILKGKVVADFNNNCQLDGNDEGLPNNIITLDAANRSYYGYSGLDGKYAIFVSDDTMNISCLTKPYWSLSSCQVPSEQIVVAGSNIIRDFFLTPQVYCPNLSVSINAATLRQCASTHYYISYCNNGTLPANNPYLEIEIDPYLTVDSASIPWVLPQSGNVYRFNLDTVGIGRCGNFKFYVTLHCDSTVLGQTHCVSAHIYPDSICLPPDPAWDGSSVKVTGQCSQGDTLDFSIKNVGANDMISPSFFLIAEDNVMYTSGNFQLAAGLENTFRIPGNGSTFTLMAEQVPSHPGRSLPMVSIEGCGVNNQGTFSKGFVTQFPQDDQNDFVDILCLQSRNAHDPNDKRPEPQGLNTEGYITASQPLDYTIRFQNTGNDTAFTVVVRDTLSPNLDITTLYLTGASHNYTFQIIGSNVLEWTFPNILLPDSNTNEALSHGFVSFAIHQTDGNTPGIEITNRAGIYFDFNAVVLTNTTLNTIINDYKTWFTFIQSPESKLQLGIYPNPNNGTFSLDFTTKPTSSYEFVMYDLAGAKQFGQILTGNAPYVLQPELPTGMYIYQLLENGAPINMGKVVVSK